MNVVLCLCCHCVLFVYVVYYQCNGSFLCGDGLRVPRERGIFLAPEIINR
jgi:hypothetical protein